MKVLLDTTKIYEKKTMLETRSKAKQLTKKIGIVRPNLLGSWPAFKGLPIKLFDARFLTFKLNANYFRLAS